MVFGAGEVANIQLQDIHPTHSGLQEVYPELGTQEAIGNYTDMLYVPPDHDGNKSNEPRSLPIDDELRWLLIRHLLIRSCHDPYDERSRTIMRLYL